MGLLLKFERERINSEFSHDQYIIKMYSVKKELEEIINLYLEKLVSIYTLLDIKYNNDPCLYFLKLKNAELQEVDRAAAEMGSRMCEFRQYLDNYLGKEIEKYMPNTVLLIGPTLALDFLLKSGSLENLVKYPAGTLQILGAEKAFFNHMRKGTPPPKHGIIFNYPGLSALPPNQRGKVARTIANKMAITLKMDYFKTTGNIEAMVTEIKGRMAL
jgi:nucleolar protein 56